MPRKASIPYTKQKAKGGVFYFKYQFPKDVADRLDWSGRKDGKVRTFLFSLKTRDPQDAKHRALRAASDCLALVQKVRTGAHHLSQPKLTVGHHWEDGNLYVASEEEVRVFDKNMRDLGVRPNQEIMPWDELPKPIRVNLLYAYENYYLPDRKEKKSADPSYNLDTEWRNAIKLFVKYVSDKEVTRITIEDAKSYNKALADAGKKPATRNKLLTALRTICKACLSRKLISINPFTGVGPDRATIRASTDSYARYDQREREILFEHLEKDENPTYVWLPRLLIFTGARLEEMAQIKRAWIKEVDGVPVIDLHKARVKSKAFNPRYVPIHKKLIELGFLEFAKNGPGDQVFNLKYRPTQGMWGPDASRDLNRRIDKIFDERSKVVHSFRKTFEHECYAQDMRKETINAITGHKPSDVSEEYYLQLKQNLPLLKIELDKVRMSPF
jgi:integrase